MTTPNSEATSGMARALNQLTEETGELVRREVQAARSEVVGKLAANIPAAALLGTAGVLSTLCIASGHRWFLRALETRIPPATAALVATIGYGVAAGLTGGLAVQWFRQAAPPLPVDTVREATKDLGAVANAGYRPGQ